MWRTDFSVRLDLLLDSSLPSLDVFLGFTLLDVLYWIYYISMIPIIILLLDYNPISMSTIFLFVITIFSPSSTAALVIWGVCTLGLFGSFLDLELGSCFGPVNPFESYLILDHTNKLDLTYNSISRLFSSTLFWSRLSAELSKLA